MYCVFIWSRGIMFVHCQLLHSWHMKVVDSFQDQLKMGMRLADFACTIGWILSWIYSCLIGTLSTQKILHQGHGGRWHGPRLGICTTGNTLPIPHCHGVVYCADFTSHHDHVVYRSVPHCHGVIYCADFTSHHDHVVCRSSVYSKFQ